MLRQLGFLSFSPATEWESFMRTIDQTAGDTTELKRWTVDATPLTKAASVWSPPELAASRSRPAAMSWLITCVIEGFASYAQAMYPCLVDPGDETTGRTQELDPQSPWQTPDDRSRTWQHSGQPWPRVATRPPSDRITFRVMRFLRMLRFGQTNHKVPVVRLDALDDRVLRDIGVDRHRLEIWAGQMEPDEW
jgi:hypothetical protein